MKPHPFPRFRTLSSSAASVAERAPNFAISRSEPVVEAGFRSLRMERRREKRVETRGEVSASFSDGGSTFGITHLELLDRSTVGLGARSSQPIEPGMRVEFWPEGRQLTNGRSGWVSAVCVRCLPEPGGIGFRIGLRTLHAAAA